MEDALCSAKALMVFSSVPVLVIFFVFQKRFIQGVVIGGVKG